MSAHSANLAFHFNSRPSARGDDDDILVVIISGKNFNSRPSARGDRERRFIATMALYFNSRPSARGDAVLIPPSARQSYFNSRPSARGDSVVKFAEALGVFQFTPLREGRHPPSEEAKRPCGFQFTPLREGRRWRGAPGIARENFNSRPSARGDAGAALLASRGKISIHAPPRGATIRIASKNSFERYFNSRPSARGDVPFVQPLQPSDISIHAPPRGATWATGSVQAARHFNSRPSARGDADANGGIPTPLVFQFTPLREGRPSGLKIARALAHISIHAPPRGATFTESTISCATENFNSRPSARGDGKRYAISANLLFNPYKSAWLNNSATQFVEIILVIFHRIIA